MCVKSFFLQHLNFVQTLKKLNKKILLSAHKPPLDPPSIKKLLQIRLIHS